MSKIFDPDAEPDGDALAPPLLRRRRAVAVWVRERVALLPGDRRRIRSHRPVRRSRRRDRARDAILDTARSGAEACYLPDREAN